MFTASNLDIAIPNLRFDQPLPAKLASAASMDLADNHQLPHLFTWLPRDWWNLWLPPLTRLYIHVIKLHLQLVLAIHSPNSPEKPVCSTSFDLNPESIELTFVDTSIDHRFDLVHLTILSEESLSGSTQFRSDQGSPGWDPNLLSDLASEDFPQWDQLWHCRRWRWPLLLEHLVDHFRKEAALYQALLARLIGFIDLIHFVDILGKCLVLCQLITIF